MADPVVLLSTGDVIGPNSATDNALVMFDGNTGKKIKGSNAVVTQQGLALLDDVDAQSQRATLGIPNVDNTSDENKPVSMPQQNALDLKANLESPTLTGAPKTPTANKGVNTQQVASCAFVLANQNPPGTLIIFAGPNTPIGYYSCNGALKNRITDADLFAAIGTYYGAGDGVTTFGLPEMRAEVPRGLDEGRGVDVGRVLGSWQDSQFPAHNHTFTGNDVLAHTHTGSTSDSQHAHSWSGQTSDNGEHTHKIKEGSPSVSSNGNELLASGDDMTRFVAAYSDSLPAGDHHHTVSGNTSTDTHNHTVTTNQAGEHKPAGTISDTGGTNNASETRSRNVAFRYLIKY